MHSSVVELDCHVLHESIKLSRSRHSLKYFYDCNCCGISVAIITCLTCCALAGRSVFGAARMVAFTALDPVASIEKKREDGGEHKSS